MSGLDGVNRGPNHRPIRSGGAKKSEKAKSASSADSDFSLEESAEPDTVAPKPPVGPRFSSLKQRIMAGVDEEKSKEEILRSVIDDEIQSSFGKHASRRMADSIAQAFDENESLRSLFNSLYSEALRGKDQTS